MNPQAQKCKHHEWRFSQGDRFAKGRCISSSGWGGVKWQKIRERTTRPGDRAQHLLSSATDQTSLLSPERIVADMQALAGRQVRICLIYPAESAAYYNYRRRLEKPLRPLQTAGVLQVHHLDQSDHGFTLLINQQLLLDHICRWMEAWCVFRDAWCLLFTQHGTSPEPHTRCGISKAGCFFFTKLPKRIPSPSFHPPLGYLPFWR